MIKQYIIQLRTWYEHLVLRERALLTLLSWSIMYAIIYLILLNPLEKQTILLHNDIKALDDQIKSWNLQMKALNKIPSTPLYKEWAMNQAEHKDLEKHYQSLLKNFSLDNWQHVIQTLLKTHNNMITLQIKNLPEAPYTSNDPSITKSSIYQQNMLITLSGSYFDTVNYLQQLEKSLPNIRWDNLSYEVADYPTAKIDMEFSVLYEKNR